MTEEKTSNKLLGTCISTVLLTLCFALVYFVSCLILNKLVPCLIATERTAQEFWVFGAAALIFCCSGLTMFKIAQKPSTDIMQAYLLRGMCFIFEGLIFIGAIAIWIEAIQYAAWVGQFEPIAAYSGTDIRYWVASVLFTNGILGNLLAVGIKI